LALSPPLHWHFWPWWDVCEPDVVVEDAENLCIIEAKLYSEFGEEATAGSQLRREWADGLQRAQEAGKQVWLVALTNHATFPKESIRRQLARASAEACRVCWLNWFEVGRFLRGLRNELVGGWTEDLLELLSRMGLAPFDGFGQVISYPTGLPWIDRVILAEERPRTVGFRGASFHPGIIGFGPAISVARGCVQRGEAQWRLRLT
jgi:hypothetical protein